MKYKSVLAPWLRYLLAVVVAAAAVPALGQTAGTEDKQRKLLYAAPDQSLKVEAEIAVLPTGTGAKITVKYVYDGKVPLLESYANWKMKYLDERGQVIVKRLSAALGGRELIGEIGRGNMTQVSRLDARIKCRKLLTACYDIAVADTSVTGEALSSEPILPDEKVSLKDAKEMTYQAQSTVEGLQKLLNYVTFNGIAPSELAVLIGNSYKPSRNQLFASKDVIIESNLSPAFSLVSTEEMTVEKYLDALDIQYEKTADASVTFSNLAISKIKKKDYLYVTVRFDEVLSSKEKASGKSYPVRQREALIRFYSQENNKWQALIDRVTFYNPALPTESPDNELPITVNESADSGLVTREDYVREMHDFLSSKQQEEKRRQVIYDEYVASGTSYVTKKQYKDALELFYKAKDLRPLVPSLDKRILDTKRLIAENTFENLKNKADQAKSERRHSDALHYYQEVLAIKPEARPTIEPEIALLNKKLDEIAFPKNKLEAGDFQGAIDACEKILKENKKAKNEFPEIFFIEGQAYQLAGEKQASDTRKLDQALENYTQALQYYPNYISARIARASFYVKYKHDYVSAITDYDAVTNNTADDAPEKPQYFVTKAEWKDQLKNYSGALLDYERAIALSPEFVAAHFGTAELLMRQGQRREALTCFNTVAKLDPKNSRLYYYRGLNYVGLKDESSAGTDFRTAEELGLAPQLLKQVEAISNGFFEEAQKAFAAKKTARADSLFDKALAIRKCNALAWHGKAEIKLTLAEETAKKAPQAAAVKQNFEQAITLYQKAIDCNPKYSDAYYKKGLAYQQTANFSQALDSYANAINTDATSVQAYMGRGDTYMYMKDYNSSISDFSKAIMLLQDNLTQAKKNSQKEQVLALMHQLSHAYQLAGQAWYYKNDYAKAVLLEEKALEQNEKNSEALYYEGLSYEAAHNNPKALKCYADAIKYAPHFKYYHAYGRASLKDEKYEQAISSLTMAIKLDTLPTLQDVRYLRGLSFFKSRMMELAYKDFTDYAKGAGPADSLFYTHFGLLNLYLNHDADAIDNFKHALNANPKYPQALFGMGCAYAKAGQFDEAIAQFEMAYQSRKLKWEDVKQEEETFLAGLNKIKIHKNRYNDMKKLYTPVSK